MAYDPYSGGVTIDLGEGDVQVERAPLQPVYLNSYKAIHTVIEGETIQSIAFQYYGDSGYWMNICDVNSIYDPFEELKPGMELFIP